MKKFLILLSIVLLSGAIIVACAPEKLKRLTQNTMRVKIEPPEVALTTVSPVQHVKAILLNANGEQVTSDNVVWTSTITSSSVPGATTLGTFSNVKGMEADFTMNSAFVGQTARGVITANCSGVLGSANVGINMAPVAPVGSVAVYSSTGSLNNGQVATLWVVVKDTNGVDITTSSAISWSPTTSSLGTFAPVTSSTKTFTANSLVGQLNITVTVGSISAQLTPPIGINGFVPFSGFIIFNDTGLSPLIKYAPLYTGEPAVYSGDANGTSDNGLTTTFMLLEGPDQGIPGVPASYTASIGIDDHVSGFRLTYTPNLSLTSGRWGGVTLSFTTPQNILTGTPGGVPAGITTVNFWAKGSVGGEKMAVLPGNDRQQLANIQVITLTSDWAPYTCTFHLPGITASSLAGCVTFLFEDSDYPSGTIVGSGPATVDIDFIYLK